MMGNCYKIQILFKVYPFYLHQLAVQSTTVFSLVLLPTVMRCSQFTRPSDSLKVTELFSNAT